MTPTLISAHAQQVLQAVHGQPGRQRQLADAAITRSWRRCLDQHRLDPASHQAPCVVEHTHLQDHRAPLERILDVARWQMNSLHRQLGGSGHVVLLTDAQGVVIDSALHPAEQKAFQRAGLWLGARWSEDCEGTNGVGTCLIERQSVTIRRDEHFRGRHASLSCSASPIFDPRGELLAVLNTSSLHEERTLQERSQAMALTSLSARLIESCHFLQQDRQLFLLRFHPEPGFTGLLGEGLIGFDESGRIMTANQAALDLLGLHRERLLGRDLCELTGQPLDAVTAHASAQPGICWPLRLADGRLLHALLRAPLPVMPDNASPRSTSLPADPRACLEDPRLQRSFERALRVLERDVPVLLQGETGTGKEAFAAALHRAGSRRGQPFVAINCAAIPESLIESELFGYKGGSFTGARRDGMVGKLEQAHGGLLFLDEIGDMPLALQTRLLRVLEAREVMPLGGTAAKALNVRVISASHQDLAALVAQGRLREDLYYRLAGFTVQLLPLRERTDKAALLDLLLREEAGNLPMSLLPEARAALLAHDWPGNVRQLRTTLRTLVALAADGRIGLDDVRELLPLARCPVAQGADPLGASERQTLLALAEAEHWHMSRVALRLGISRNTLYRKLRQHGISRERTG